MDRSIIEQIYLDQDSALPLASQLAKQITWLIARGDIKKGEALPPIREFANFIGIHMHTVRAAYHILENQDLVSIRPKIGTIVKEYIPFKTNSKWSDTPKQFIVIQLPNFTDFYNELMRGIQDTAEQENLIPMAISCDNNPIFAENSYFELSSKEFAGVINVSLGFSDEYHEKFKIED